MSSRFTISAPKTTKASDEMLAKIHDLAWAGKHAQAIDLATQALAAPEKGGSQFIQKEMDLLDLRSESYLAQGKLDLAARDAQAMLKLANVQKTPTLKAQALNRKALVQMRQGDLPAAVKTAASAVRIAQSAGKSNQTSLLAIALLRLGEAQFRVGQLEAAIDNSQQALTFFQTEGDLSNAGRAWWAIANVFSLQGHTEDAARAAQSALELCQQAGDQYGTGNALNAFTNVDKDIADRLRHLQQSYQAFETAGYQDRQVMALGNLSISYSDLGLYRHARRLTETATNMNRDMGTKLGLAYGLGNLAELEMRLGQLDQARAHGQELAGMVASLGDFRMDSSLASGWGSLALAEGDPKTAVRHFKTAVQIAQQVTEIAQIGFLAQLGQAYLANGNFASALKATRKATSLHRRQGFPALDGGNPQEIWWRHVQTLLANGQKQEAEKALERAYAFLLDGIANVRDEGLRRNYLNKVEANRELLQFWVEDGIRRKLPRERMFAHLAIESNLREPFQRLADTGLRLNALHNAAEIQTFLVEEATELSGGERVALILEKDGKPEVVESILPRGEDAQKLLRDIATQLKQTELTRTASLTLPKKAGLSRIVAPLIAQNQVTGYLYADMDSIYGTFTEIDRDMLGMLANQAAVALDNAQWTQGLEQKVAERTEALNARVGELDILNSVGEAMAKTMDVKTVTRIVGDKVRDIFHADVASILLLNPQDSLIHPVYDYDNGEGGYVDYYKPFPLGKGLTSKVIQSRRPLLLGTIKEQEENGAYLPPETLEIGSGISTESVMMVPIVIGDKVLGVVTVSNYKQNAFNVNDLRLLQTLSANMAVAIQNARLFETEQQRNNELAIINSVQQGLASKLDLQSIYDLVGDKIRQIFNAQSIGIFSYAHMSELVYFNYSYESGQRFYPDPVPFTNLVRHLIASRKPLMVNENWPERAAELGTILVPGTQNSKSVLFVPMMVGESVHGMISLQNVDRENAFSEADVRLLTTLASSMSVALENARLFDETERLLKETEQRNAELAVINSIQQGLAAELNFQAVVDLVGDKLREIFRSPDLIISWFEEKANLLHYLYAYEHGKRLNLPAQPPGARGMFVTVNKTHQPLVFNTREDFVRFNVKYFPGTSQSKSMAIIPIISGDHVLGIIHMENHVRENAFGEAEIRLLTTIAGSLGAALQNAFLFDETQRLLKETEQRNNELAIINSVQQGLASKLDFQAIVDLVGDKLREVFGIPDISINWYDEKENLLHYLYSFEHGKRMPVISSKPIPGGIFETHQKNHQPIIYRNQEDYKKFGAGPVEGTDQSKSMVSVPIISSDRVLGVIMLENYEREDAYGDADVRLLTTIAASLGSALNNAHLFSETQRLLNETEQRNAELAIINEVQRGLAAELNFQTIIDLVGDKLRQVFTNGDIGVRWYDLHTKKLHFLYEYEHGKRLFLPPQQLPDDVAGRFEQARAPQVYNDRAAFEASGVKLLPGTDQSMSAVMVPIIGSDHVIGQIDVENYERENAYSEADVRLLQTVASSMGVALENARLFDETQRLLKETEQRNAELAVINSIQQGLAAELDFQAIVDLVGDKLREVFKVPDFFINWYEEKTDLVNFLYCYEHGQRLSLEPLHPGADTIIARLIKTKRPLMWNTREEGDRLALPIPGTDSSKAGIAVPIISGDRVLGSVQVENYQQENVYNEADLRLLTTVTGSLGAALENARLFDETQRLLKETEQRASELAIINSVQKGLASKLDMQAIFDLVGDKIQSMFNAQSVMIQSYDHAKQLTRVDYGFENGEHIYDEALLPYSLLAKRLVETHQPVVINENSTEISRQYGLTTIEGTLAPKSLIFVPFGTGAQVNGCFSLQNFEQEHAFSESDIRLLQTLAGSMGIALENARLFSETQRLLKETEQRASELAIINSVQEGLASKLDMQAIYDLVGDKIRGIFTDMDATIRIYDPQTNLIEWPYVYCNGERVTMESNPLTKEGFIAYVLRTRKTLVINDHMEQAAKKYHSVLYPGLQREKSSVHVPLVIGDQAIGVITLVDMHREGVFSESGVRMLETLADSMSVALENTRLFDETQHLLKETEQRNSELAIINSIQEGLASKLDVQGVYDLIGQKMGEIFNVQVVDIVTYDPTTNLLSMPFSYEKGDRSVITPREPYGFRKQVIERGAPLLVNENFEALASKAGNPVLTGVMPKSALFVPLLMDGKVKAIISIQDLEKENSFSPSDVRLMQTLANAMSVATENARLFDETQRLLKQTEQRAAELATVNTLSQALASATQLDVLIQLTGEQMRRTFEADIVYVALLDAQTNLITFPYAFGEEMPSLQLGEGLTSKILQAGKPLLINKDMNTRRAALGVKLTGHEALSYLGVPILANRQAIGVISVQSTHQEGQFDEDDMRLLTTLASNVGVAIEKARLLNETQRRARESAAIAEVGREISATLDLKTVMERIAAHALDLLECDTSAVYLPDETGQKFRAVAVIGEAADEIKQDTVLLGNGIIGDIASRGVAELIADTSRDPRARQIPGTTFPNIAERMMVAPLLAGERVIGMMTIWREGGQEFTQAELEFLIGLSRQAAIAIQNARLFSEVQDQRKFSEALIDFLPDATVVINCEGKVIAWNRAMEEMTGVPAKDMLGKGNYEYSMPFYGERRPILIDLVLLPRKEFEAKYAQIQRDGNILIGETYTPSLHGGRYMYATASALHDSQGNVTGAIETIRDITERKQAEVELQNAKEAAEAANASKSAFLAMMSHEIRTPMNAVIGMSGLLLDTKLTGEQRDFAEIIRNSSDALLAIINDILDFSKIEAGKMDLESQPFDLREVVESALDLVASRAVEKGLEIAYTFDNDVPAAILGDVTRLRQILINLLGNAVKFTEQGEVVVNVSRTEAASASAPKSAGKPNKMTLKFTVRDTGIGIPPDRMGRLFQSFSQADSSTSRKYGGTGLGLAISKRLTGMMGGDLWAESSGIAGEGSSFMFTIETEAVEMPERTKRDLRGAQPYLSGKRVLIVDDNATNRRILTLQLQAWGMQTRDSESPEKALQWVKQGDPFDLAILDMHMPGMDGVTLAREIRKLRNPESLLLVLFSSLGRRESGADPDLFTAFLGKPIKPSQLFDTLAGLFAEEPKKEQQAAPKKTQLDAEMARNHPLRILLAEDILVNQKLALRLLQQMGYRADVASNGIEAVQSVERQPYDVILMDVQMPEMDGLEASRRICARWPRGQRPTIIAMTANAMQGDREMCLEAGMDDYVSKPIRPDELVKALMKVNPVKKR